jgi:hypothetical protein
MDDLWISLSSYRLTFLFFTILIVLHRAENFHMARKSSAFLFIAYAFAVTMIHAKFYVMKIYLYILLFYFLSFVLRASTHLHWFHKWCEVRVQSHLFSPGYPGLPDLFPQNDLGTLVQKQITLDTGLCLWGLHPGLHRPPRATLHRPHYCCFAVSFGTRKGEAPLHSFPK